MEHTSGTEVFFSAPSRHLAHLTDPNEAVESVSRKVLTSPGGTVVVVNGTECEVRHVTASTFQKSGYLANTAGNTITNGP